MKKGVKFAPDLAGNISSVEVSFALVEGLGETVPPLTTPI